MTFENRLSAFVELGLFLNRQLLSPSKEFQAVIRHANLENAWFTEDNIRFAFEALVEDLREENLSLWTSDYSHIHAETLSKNIAIIMAGNIPMVGFRDFLATLISGHRALCKLSSKDSVLLPFLAKNIIDIAPDFGHFIAFEKQILKGFDAIIATGGNQAKTHFYTYFSKYRHLIRGHRNSCAILNGKETEDELKGLFEDMFRYFGLGCRNVTKLFVPLGYDFSNLLQAAKKHKKLFRTLEQHHLYQNNYQYQSVISSINRQQLLDSGVFILLENSTFTPPISVVNFEYYDDYQFITSRLDQSKEQLQGVVSHQHIPFGKAQKPRLSDYSDEKDTLLFLQNL